MYVLATRGSAYPVSLRSQSEGGGECTILKVRLYTPTKRGMITGVSHSMISVACLLLFLCVSPFCCEPTVCTQYVAHWFELP